MNAVIYARFSSDMQSTESIDAQVRACKDYAAVNGFTVTRVYSDEAISGTGSKTANRVQYQKLLKDAEREQFEVVLTHKYDRIARNVGEHVNLELRLSTYGIRLIAVAQDFGASNEAKIMKTMMWALSEYYVDNLADEVKKGLKENALKGVFNGGYAPFGYDIQDQKYVINDLEARYVKKMFECALNREGFTELISEMEQAGIRGKRGRLIKYTQIYEILRNERYTGVYAYSTTEEKDRNLRRAKPNAIKIENALPIIIDRALFDEVQMIMDARKQSGAKSEYLCSGLVYCGKCGAKMHGTTTKRKGHEYRIYYCSQKCGVGTIHMDMIDAAVKEYLEELLSPANLLTVNQALKAYTKDERSRLSDFNTRIRLQIEEKQKQIDNYMNTLGSGALPPELITDIGQKIVVLKSEVAGLKETPIPKDFTVEQINVWLESLRDSTDDRKTVELLVERVDATKTAVTVTSTLTAVLGENGG